MQEEKKNSWLLDAMQAYADMQEERNDFYTKYAVLLEKYDKLNAKFFDTIKLLARHTIQYSRDVATDKNKYRISIDLTDEQIKMLFDGETNLLALRGPLK